MVNHRKAAEKLYTGTCSIYEYHKVFNEDGCSYTHKEVLVYEGLPCRISFSTRQSYTGLKGVEEGELGNKSKHFIKLFLSPDIDVLPGSKIVINQNGREFVYKNSTNPAVFESHQEILLGVFDKWF